MFKFAASYSQRVSSEAVHPHLTVLATGNDATVAYFQISELAFPHCSARLLYETCAAIKDTDTCLATPENATEGMKGKAM